MDLKDRKGSKKWDLITTYELLDEAELEAEQLNLPRPNLAAEDTYEAERKMSAAGVRTASEKSRQLSASSPASSRASGGAKVWARWRGGRRDFDREVCVYL